MGASTGVAAILAVIIMTSTISNVSEHEVRYTKGTHTSFAILGLQMLQMTGHASRVAYLGKAI